MRKFLFPATIALLFAVLLCCGCNPASNSASLSRLAVEKSNHEAKRLYSVEPFKPEDGQLRADGQQSVWEALTSSGGKDIKAIVIFDERGAVVDVDVKMLVHPAAEPLPNLDTLPGSDIQREKKSVIPEVMPK